MSNTAPQSASSTPAAAPRPPTVLAITACPTGIAHTYMAAENLESAAAAMGIDLKVETHGSIGVEGAFTEADIALADAVIVAADTTISTDRFAGLPLVRTGVDEAIKAPQQLLQRALHAEALPAASAAAAADGHRAGNPGYAADEGRAASGLRAVGQDLYKALMNGVSHMVPFVVTGGLLIAVALSVGGHPTAEGMVIDEGTFWYTLNQLGALAFSLMVPVLSAYIAVGIADRPGLAPGFITGLIATTGSLYGSEAGAGFLGGIVTGILSGYVALGIKKIPVNKFVAPIWPIIVIPIATTLLVGLAFVYVIGGPIATAFDAMTRFLASMDGSSVVVLGAIIGAMIAFDMGGPFNKTAFLFGGGMIAAGNAVPMGMAACAIAVPPLAVGVATQLRRAWFTKSENDSGIAALLMGLFGITEGAIPLAAARPLQVIPANVIGGALAGLIGGAFQVQDHVMHGGPIVAVLGAVDGVGGFTCALLAGVAVDAALILLLVGWSKARASRRRAENSQEDPSHDPAHGPTNAPAAGDAPLLTPDLVLLESVSTASRDEVISQLVGAAARAGRVSSPAAVVEAALQREAQHSTGVGHGVAIPHARSEAVTAATIVFARLPHHGVAWGAGEEPSDLVFLIAVPADAGREHLAILARLARSLNKETFRHQLRAATSAEEAVRVIEGAVGKPAPARS